MSTGFACRKGWDVAIRYRRCGSRAVAMMYFCRAGEWKGGTPAALALTTIGPFSDRRRGKPREVILEIERNQLDG